MQEINKEHRAAYIRERSLLLTVGVKLAGFPPDEFTGLAMIRSGLIGCMCVNRVSPAELRSFIDELIAELSKVPLGGLSIDQALADAKAHAAKGTSSDGNGSPR